MTIFQLIFFLRTKGEAQACKDTCHVSERCPAAISDVVQHFHQADASTTLPLLYNSVYTLYPSLLMFADSRDCAVSCNNELSLLSQVSGDCHSSWPGPGLNLSEPKHKALQGTAETCKNNHSPLLLTGQATLTHFC